MKNLIYINGWVFQHYLSFRTKDYQKLNKYLLVGCSQCIVSVPIGIAKFMSIFLFIVK